MPSLLDRLKHGLSRTRDILDTPVEDLVRGRRLLDAQALESVEEALLAADMGVPAVQEAIEVLRARSGEIAGGGKGAMRAVLRAEPFNLEALKAAMSEMRTARQVFDRRIHDFFAQQASQMSPAGRQKLADRPGSRRETGTSQSSKN